MIIVKISPPGKPSIQMITEASIIGKIGFNSDVVGVCFNAIRAKGVDRSRIPVHLGLRLILESSSAEQAVRSLEEWGIAAAAHILIADKNSSIGFKFSSSTTARLRPDSKGRLIHSTVSSATLQGLPPLHLFFLCWYALHTAVTFRGCSIRMPEAASASIYRTAIHAIV